MSELITVENEIARDLAREAGMSVAEYRAYIRWLRRERGSYASWEGPTCSPAYYLTYVAGAR